MSGIQIEGLSKRYRAQHQPAVDDLTLNVVEGEIFTLLGPSGCGKTSTLRIIAGLERPDAGTLRFDQREIVDARRGIFVQPEHRNIGMVFQSYAIWPHMTVAQNVSFPLELRRFQKREIAEYVSRALALVGLESFADRPGTLLSGGQQQRVALARAIVYEPSVLLLDEPFSNLDTKLREQMRVEIKQLQARLGLTVVLVTHDQVEALSLSSRIAVMRAGKVLQVDTPIAVYNSPRTAFVRDFVGKSIVLRGTIIERTNDCLSASVKGAGGPLLVRPADGIEARVGDEVDVVARPSDAQLHPKPPADSGSADAAVQARILARLFVGERVEYEIEVEDNGTFQVSCPYALEFAEGQAIWLTFNKDSLTAWR